MICLCGGMATGKTTVLKEWKKLGAKIIRADEIGHQVLEEEEVKKAIVRKFGERVLSNGRVDRKKLGKLVFGDREALDFLNKLTHPRINRKIKEMIENMEGVIVIEAAIVFEMGLYKLCDYIVATYCPREEQMARLLEDGFTREEAEARLASQMPPEYYAGRSHVIIFTTESPEKTLKDARKIYKLLTKKGGRVGFPKKQS